MGCVIKEVPFFFSFLIPFAPPDLLLASLTSGLSTSAKQAPKSIRVTTVSSQYSSHAFVNSTASVSFLNLSQLLLHSQAAKEEVHC